MTDSMQVHGACHCGAIAFEAMVDPLRVTICHCTACQNLTGTAYRVTVAASAQGFRVTRLASTGGFLRKGNTTLLAGVEETAVERALAIARRTAPGALVITLDLERYERI